MPLDVRGCTRATIVATTGLSSLDRVWQTAEMLLWLELSVEIFSHERGIPSKCESSTCIDYVPALCTHRPSLPGTELFREIHGSADFGLAEKWLNRDGLNRAKVVTRYL
jgi:hypothetical protein